MTIDTDAAWAAVAARDVRADGRFVFAVKTTRVYCRPSCPARRPLRANAEFYRDAAAAEKAGYRECRRCRPRSEGGPAAEAEWAAAAKRLIDSHLEEPLRLSDVARELKISTSRLSRYFSRHQGVTPKRYAILRRLEAFKNRSRKSGVTEAQYASGFGAPSRLYAAARSGLGMTPGAYARGGAGEVISYGFADSPVGRVLIASTPRGVCSVELGDSTRALEKNLKRRFPRATLRSGARVSLAALPRAALDLRGTAFQRAVWEALRRIPAGRTKTYAEVARDIGRPSAARAVARACATNEVALAIPCHRVVGAGGHLRGYRWGVARKRRLLELEGASVAA
jgi:AraC family transcriptional regulator of adaptative response/methylated-DNA-[protein]-cysteine methyltransferase